MGEMGRGGRWRRREGRGEKEGEWEKGEVEEGGGKEGEWKEGGKGERG